jgi:transcriptional regulator with XRE-family HTH domain
LQTFNRSSIIISRKEVEVMDLKKIRLEQGMTQTQVAAAVGVSLTAYLLWERGVGKPTEENKEKLYKTLGIQNE